MEPPFLAGAEARAASQGRTRLPTMAPPVETLTKPLPVLLQFNILLIFGILTYFNDLKHFYFPNEKNIDK